ncbi:MAG: DUF4340 domain-containing protein, partial [Kiritimatiellae bacterium]|nr:DUF4340 domain-containing protein [Kiritimatiellia bacterium]
ALDAWLELLSRLRAARIETLRPSADHDPYGLTSPYLEATIDLIAEDALRRVLRVGEITPKGERYAVVKGYETVFVLAPETVRLLDQSLVRPAIPADSPLTPAPIEEIP